MFPQPQEPPPPPRRRHRGLYWSGVLVAAAALVVGAVVAVTSYLGASRPAGVVRDYFAALARGDAPGALAYGDLPDGTHAWLTDAVLRAQNAVGRISHVTVISVDPHGTTRQVHIQYDLDGPAGSTAISDTVKVTREGRTWRLTPVAVAVRLDVTAAADRARLAGSAVPSGTVLLFPGALPITFDTPALTVAPDDRAVRFAGGDVLTADVQVSAPARDKVQDAVTDAFTACLAGSYDRQAMCPVPADGRTVPGSLRGSVTSPVDAGLRVTVDKNDSGVLDVSAVVEVDGSYQQLDFNNIAQTKQGSTRVSLTARCLASAPGSIVWSTS